MTKHNLTFYYYIHIILLSLYNTNIAQTLDATNVNNNNKNAANTDRIDTSEHKLVQTSLNMNSNTTNVNNTSSSSSSIINVNNDDDEGSIIAKHGLPHSSSDDDLIGSGALLRGFYVFAGFSVILLLYFAIKSYRLRKKSTPPTHIRKYGIRARRGDVEMLPLPLEEDDEDDTLFEISGGGGINSQQNDER